MHLILIGLLILSVPMLATYYFIRGAALYEREAVKLDEAFKAVRKAIDPLAGLRS